MKTYCFNVTYNLGQGCPDVRPLYDREGAIHRANHLVRTNQALRVEVVEVETIHIAEATNFNDKPEQE